MLAQPRRLARSSSLLFAVVLATGGCIDAGEQVSEDRAEIVGGADTDIALVPWQVSLQNGNGSHFCGGSIVAPTWIVTAAHCVEGGAPARIVAGSTRLSQPGAGQVVQVLRAISAPGYVDASQGKDLALLELAAPLVLNGTSVRAIRPVTSLDAQAGIDAPGVTATVSGWGTLASGAQTLPDTLQSVQVPIVSLADASADYGANLSADQLAAGVRGIGGRDSCQGDSGGPLVVTSTVTGETKLAGVVSWGIGCADPNYPGMYARVSSFFAMIDDYAGGLPTAVAGGDQTVTAGNAVSVDASASTDVGVGSIVSYEWVQTLGIPVNITAAGATASFTAPSQADDIELELTVTDDRGNTATDRVSIRVEAPVNPPGGGNDPGNPPGGGGSDPANPGGGRTPSDIVGGCSTGNNSGGSMLLLLVALGLIARRRRASLDE